MIAAEIGSMTPPLHQEHNAYDRNCSSPDDLIANSTMEGLHSVAKPWACNRLFCNQCNRARAGMPCESLEFSASQIFGRLPPRSIESGGANAAASCRGRMRNPRKSMLPEG
jgi:hypothetical protein